MNDLHSLIPHSRKDAKLDTKTKLYQLNEIAELYNCNNIFFFEARKGKDLYAWLSKPPNGPTVKFHLQNCTPFNLCFDSEPPTNHLCSAYYGGAAFHGQLPKGLPPNPLV